MEKILVSKINPSLSFTMIKGNLYYHDDNITMDYFEFTELLYAGDKETSQLIREEIEQFFSVKIEYVPVNGFNPDYRIVFI